MKSAKTKTEKKKYAPEVLNTYKYRDFKITEILNRKTSRREFKVRFQLNNKEFYLTDERRKKLEELIDETIHQERRAKYGLSVPTAKPSLAAVFAAHLPTLKSEQRRALFDRVTTVFLSLLPENIKINELRRAHFQKYIDLRFSQPNRFNGGKPVVPETVNKELYAISGALKSAPLRFAELEDYQKPVIPKAAARNRRRERLVSPEAELNVLLAELRAPRQFRQTEAHVCHRRRLADELEFRYLTGLRRAEATRLKWTNFDAAAAALRNVVRWKTDTVSKFLPLPARAVEIIEARRESNKDFDYIFSQTGEVQNSDYRTLKTVCATLGIKYGKFTENGFVGHDLRHNFASEIIQVTDIETAKSLTGHTGTDIFTYLHTTERQQREAVGRREKRDRKVDLTNLYNLVITDQIDVAQFLRAINAIFG